MRKLYIVGERKKQTEEAKRYYFKAQEELKAGKLIKAIQYLKQSLKIKSDYQPAFRDLAEIYQEYGNINEAQRYIQKALEINPEDPVSLFIQGVIYINQGDIKPALKFFERAQQHGELTWGLAYNLGLCHYGLGNFDISIQLLNNAIQKDPSQPYPYLLLAQIFLRQNRASMAQAILMKAKKMRPNDKQLDLWISEILNLKK